MDNDLLTAEEIGSHLSLRASTINMWARQGRIPAHRFSRKVIRFRLPEVMSALEQAESAQPTEQLALPNADGDGIDAT